MEHRETPTSKDKDGRRVVDFGENNLHVVNYSAPVKARMSLGELRPHLHSLPDHPEWIPYRTSYYTEILGLLPVATAAREPCRG